MINLNQNENLSESAKFIILQKQFEAEMMISKVTFPHFVVFESPSQENHCKYVTTSSIIHPFSSEKYANVFKNKQEK